MKVRILAATDGSRASAAALRFAVRLALASRGRLDVVTVGELPPSVIREGPGSRSLSSFERSDLRSVRAALERSRSETRGMPSRVRCDYVAARGLETFAETISRQANRLDADLLVLGSRGGIPVTRWLLGSVANRLVHLARRPVAIVRTGAKRSRTRVARILVATDGSPASARAVRFAARLTSAIPGARLVILTVSTLTADLALTAPSVFRALGVMPDLERADRQAARRTLAKAAALAALAGLGKRATLRYYRPAGRAFAEKAILEESRRQRADVIVLGRTGRSALGDVLMGSVAQRVLALAGPPVILVPESGRT